MYDKSGCDLIFFYPNITSALIKFIFIYHKLRAIYFFFLKIENNMEVKLRFVYLSCILCSSPFPPKIYLVVLESRIFKGINGH